MPVPPKKLKLSSLNGSELQLAYNHLLMLKRNIEYEEADPNEPAPEGFEQQLDTMLSLLQSKLEGPLALTFSGMTYETLTNLKITFTGIFKLKPGFEEHVAATTLLGQNELWSSTNLYNQLHLLGGLIPRTTDACSHAWIDAFFFRISAMLPPEQHMVLNMEHTIPAAIINPPTHPGYTAVVASQQGANIYLKSPKGPRVHLLKTLMPSGFFVIEAKLFNPMDQIPQAVYEMYMIGKLLQKKVLRGALTNGRDWIFLLIKFNNNYNEAFYQYSLAVQLRITESTNGQLVIPGPWPDLIAAILLHWIQNSFIDLRSDDLFELHQ